jgi:hypothetical protein
VGCEEARVGHADQTTVGVGGRQQRGESLAGGKSIRFGENRLKDSSRLVISQGANRQAIATGTQEPGPVIAGGRDGKGHTPPVQPVFVDTAKLGGARCLGSRDDQGLLADGPDNQRIEGEALREGHLWVEATSCFDSLRNAHVQ